MLESRLLEFLTARGAGLLLWQQDLVNVGQNSTTRNSDAREQLVEFLVVSHSQLDVARNDTSLLVVARSISRQLHDLGNEILNHSCQVDGSALANTGRTSDELAKQTVRTSNAELQTSTVRSRVRVTSLLLAYASARRLGLGGIELGHSLGSLAYSMLSEFSRQQETNSGLDLSASDSVLLHTTQKHANNSAHLSSEPVDEGVHDAHSILANSSVGMNLLQNLVDVGLVGTIVTLGVATLALTGLLSRGLALRWCLGCHCLYVVFCVV